MHNPIIQVKDVTKAVGERQLLSQVSFSVQATSLVSLIGPNGAGKSTLVKIILGLDSHYTGQVEIDPAARVSYIPQITDHDPYQLPLSVREYLAIGTTPLYNQHQQVVNLEQTLTHVGVDPAVLTQSFTTLSGGERQRIAIARALLSDPTVLILDEPLAAVDYASRAGLYELIRHLQQDHHMTVLLVSHDIDSVLPLSDRVLCLNQTLHTDCHPSALNRRASAANTIHHHC